MLISNFFFPEFVPLSSSPCLVLRWTWTEAGQWSGRSSAFSCIKRRATFFWKICTRVEEKKFRKNHFSIFGLHIFLYIIKMYPSNIFCSFSLLLIKEVFLHMKLRDNTIYRTGLKKTFAIIKQNSQILLWNAALNSNNVKKPLVLNPDLSLMILLVLLETFQL